jgi:hypothetical protein
MLLESQSISQSFLYGCYITVVGRENENPGDCRYGDHTLIIILIAFVCLLAMDVMFDFFLGGNLGRMTPSSSSWNNTIFVTRMRLWFFPFLVGLPLEVMLCSVLCSNPHRYLAPSGGGFLSWMFCIQVVVIRGLCLKDMMLSVQDVLTSTPSYVGVSSSPLWA